MITIQPETQNSLLVVKASEKLTTRDYEAIFIPKLQELITRYHNINVVIDLDSSFKGWELEAIWDDVKFGTKHRNDFNRIALVGAPTWVKWATSLAAHFMPGQVKFYDSSAFQEAMIWAKG